jgi:hypothetical protein
MGLGKKIAYAGKVLPAALRRGFAAQPRGPVHLMIALADHFEPAIDPEDGQNRVSQFEQEQRMEAWTRDYPKAVDRWRDHDGRPFVHTYFYPAEQYDEGIVEMLAEHCHAGWGEAEIHLHHGIPHPDTAENTRNTLTEFRDRLAHRHRCLASDGTSSTPRYSFVHGNFALANSADGKFCGVDSEMQILAETGCYADFTLPTGLHHPAQTAKINSLYEYSLPANERAPHRAGNDLVVGKAPRIFPIMVQGPLIANVRGGLPSARLGLETGAITRVNPMSVHRLELWKQARIGVKGRPDWIFVKVHCHGMDPLGKDVVIGEVFTKFLEELVTGASARKETLHFVTAREMTNILLAACDGKSGNPGDYRDYRLKRIFDTPISSGRTDRFAVGVKG